MCLNYHWPGAEGGTGNIAGIKAENFTLESFQCGLYRYRDCLDALRPVGLVNALEDILQRAPRSGKPLTPIPHGHIKRNHQKKVEQPCSSMKQQTPGVNGATQLCTRDIGDCSTIAEQEVRQKAETSMRLGHSKDLPRL